MRMHGQSLYDSIPALQLTLAPTEFDKETFGVMSDMIKADSSLPLIFAPQTEYREGVSISYRYSRGVRADLAPL